MDLPTPIIVRKIAGKFYDAAMATELSAEDLWGWTIAGIRFVVLDESGEEATVVGGGAGASARDNVVPLCRAIPHGATELGRRRSGRASGSSATWRRRLYALLAILTIVSFSPAASLAGAIAGAFGCQLDEGGPHACLVFGTDRGDALYFMEVSGWLMLWTWPGMLITLGVWLFLLCRVALRRFRGHPTRNEAALHGDRRD